MGKERGGRTESGGDCNLAPVWLRMAVRTKPGPTEVEMTPRLPRGPPWRFERGEGRMEG